ADGVKYQENGALTASSDFTVTIDNLDPKTAVASAKTTATFVTVVGQNINELTATTDYNADQLDFDINAKQPKRSLAAAGSLLLHTEHQEVHLRRLDLQSQGVRWQTPDGVEPAVQYGGDVITVKGLRLVNSASGDQEMAAEGSFGGGDTLNVTLKNVDVA